MKKFATIATLASSFVFAAAASADTLIAYWNFNSFDPSTDTMIAADAGVGTVDLSGWGGGVANFAGSPINTLFGDPSGASLSLQAGDDLAGNGTYIDITFSMTGLQDLHVSFATRGTGTGFDSGTWQYDIGSGFESIDGVDTATTSTSFSLAEFFAGSALNDAASVTLRYTLDGATTSSGNNRIDNLQLNASMIPAPGALALLGLAGLIGTSRRRRA